MYPTTQLYLDATSVPTNIPFDTLFDEPTLLTSFPTSFNASTTPPPNTSSIVPSKTPP